jgi:hypothetical protein
MMQKETIKTSVYDSEAGCSGNIPATEAITLLRCYEMGEAGIDEMSEQARTQCSCLRQDRVCRGERRDCRDERIGKCRDVMFREKDARTETMARRREEEGRWRIMFPGDERRRVSY